MGYSFSGYSYFSKKEYFLSSVEYSLEVSSNFPCYI